MSQKKGGKNYHIIAFDLVVVISHLCGESTDSESGNQISHSRDVQGTPCFCCLFTDV